MTVHQIVWHWITSTHKHQQRRTMTRIESRWTNTSNIMIMSIHISITKIQWYPAISSNVPEISTFIHWYLLTSTEIFTAVSDRCHHLYDDIWILIYINIKTNYDSITKTRANIQHKKVCILQQTRHECPDGGLSVSGRQLVNASRRNAVNRDRVFVTSAKRSTACENSPAVHISPHNSGAVIDSEKKFN